MAVNIGELICKISANSAEFRKEVNSAVDTLSKSVKEIERHSNMIKNMWLFDKANTVFHHALDEVIDAERSMKSLEQSLRSTGAQYRVTKDSILEMSQALSTLSGQDDDAINAMEGVLLAFKSISGQELPRVSAAVMDLAAKMQTDLPTAAKMVGRALDEPGKGLGRLERATGAFTDAEEKAIKHAMAMGDSMKARAVVLNHLEGAAIGTAAAMRDTLGGAFMALDTAAGNLQETLLGVKTGGSAIRDIIELIVTVTEDATNAIAGFNSALQSLANNPWLQMLKQASSQDAESQAWGSMTSGITNYVASVQTRTQDRVAKIHGYDLSDQKTVSGLIDKYLAGGGTPKEASAYLAKFKNSAANSKGSPGTGVGDLDDNDGKQAQQTAKQIADANKKIQETTKQTGQTYVETKTEVTNYYETLHAELSKTANTWENYRAELEKTAKTNVGDEMRLKAIDAEDAAVQRYKQSLVDLQLTYTKLNAGKSIFGMDDKGNIRGAVKAEGMTDDVNKLQARAQKSLDLQNKYKDMLDIKTSVKDEMELYETARKMEIQLDKLHGTSGKFTGTLTEGLVTANAQGSAQEQLWFRIAQQIAGATGAVTQYAGAMRGIGGAGASAYLRAASGGNLTASSPGAVQTQGGGYTFSPALAEAKGYQGPAKNVNNQDLPMGATYNVAPLEGRARGGSVRGGQAYSVGEFGEETFIPGMSGQIVPLRKKVDLMNAAEQASMLDKYNQYKMSVMEKMPTDRGNFSNYQLWTWMGRNASSYGRGASFGGPAGQFTDSMYDEMIQGGFFGDAMAEGGISGGGTTLVGERGPELVDLPRGARVTPNNNLPQAQPVQINVSSHTVEPVEVHRSTSASGVQTLAIIGKQAKRYMSTKPRAY